MSPRPLAALFAALATCLPALAQGVYYVDGLTGLDAPGRGTTAAAPWRTITYAMANATPPAAGVATIRIQGGQSYAPASNGETYPVTLAPNVALEGVAAGGSLPVLAVPAGVTGLQLAPITNHPSPGMVHRNFVVQGGAIGFDLGAVFGVSHVATVEGCEFRGQSTACLQSSPRTGSNDLTVRRCKLDGLNNGGIGIAQDSTTQSYPGPQHNLLVTGCTLRNLSRGVSVESSLHPSWNYTTTIEGTTIEACGTGLRFTTPAAPSGFQVRRTILAVARTRITDCNLGIYTAELPPTGATNSLDVNDVSVARCLTGAELRTSGAFSPLLPLSSFRSTWTRSLFANCGKAVDLAMNCDGRMTARFQGTDFLSNGDNVVGATQFGNYTVELSGCRILDGGSGIALSGAFQTWKPTLTMTDCLIGRHAGVGISVNEGILDVTSSTIADTATAIVNTATRGTVTACLFSGNATDVQVNNPVGFPWPFLSGACATDSATTVPGGSNLQFAPVGLQRPNLKLARSSPCIDRIGVSGTDYEGDPRGVATNAGATVFGDIGADEYVPTGSLRRYGLPTYGAVAASPTVGSPNTTAVLGGSYTVQLAGAIAGSLPFLATGVEDVAAPLPNELGLIGLPGCHLWLDPIVLQTLPPVGPAGATSAAVAIPNQPALLGFVLTHQWLVGLPLPDGFVTSDALRVTVGQ